MNGLFVFIGGGFGAFVRYLLYLILPKASYLPMSTLTANFFGCFIGAVVFIYFVTKSDLNSAYKIFFITGFCGGLSTLSALSIELFEFIQAGEYLRAFIYVLTTIIICTAAVILSTILVKHNFN